MVSLVLLALLTVLTSLPTRGQAQQGNQSPEPPEKPKDLPSFVLEDVYMFSLGRPPDERGFLLLDMAETFRSIDPERAASLYEELFNTSLQMPLDWHNYRYAFQFNAVRGLSELRLSSAAELFQQMEAQRTDPDTLPSQDLRAIAAVYLFPKVVERDKETGIAWVQNQARRLGETGQYPYAAIRALITQSPTQDRLVVEALFQEARTYFKKDSGFSSTPREFLRLAETVRESVPKQQFDAALQAVVDALLSSPKQAHQAFLSRAYLRNGKEVTFATQAERMLYELLPKIQAYNPKLAEQILEEKPPLRSALEPDGQIEKEEAILVEGRVDNAERLRFVQEEGFAWQRVERLQELAEQDPLEAARQAKDIAILGAQLAAEANVAAALAKTNPTAARAALSKVLELLNRVESPNDQLRASLAVLRAQKTLGDGEAALWTLARILHLGEELIEQEVLLGPGVPVSYAPAYEPLSEAIILVAPIDAEQVLTLLNSTANLVLQSHLKIELVRACLQEPGRCQPKVMPGS